MNNAVFLNKENPLLPDNYGVEITYVNNKTESFKVVQHHFIADLGLLELVTTDDEYIDIQTANTFKIKFDKAFSTIVALKKEQGGK